MTVSTPEKIVGSDWRASGRVLFAVIFLINALNYADRFVLSAVATEIKASLGLNDAQLGLIGTAFILVYALTAIPLGVLADRARRTFVIAAGVAAWSLATALTGFTRSFGQLLAARAFVGIGESSYFPASTSLLADAFPHETRGRLMSWWNLALLVGVFLGYAGGGVVGGRFGWSAAFYLVALPGLILAGVVALLHEPIRGASERLGAAPAREGWRAATARLLETRSLVAAILAQASSFFVLGGVSFWIPTYMHERFGLTTSAAGLLSGGVVVVAGGVGTLLGGYLADSFLARGFAGARLAVPGFGYLLGAPVVLLGVLAPTLGLFLVCFGVGAGLLQAASGPLTALSQDVVIPSRRAQAVAIALLVVHVLGDASAPPVLGLLADHLGGLEHAFLFTPPALLLAALFAFLGSRSVAADRQRVLSEATFE